MGFFTFIGVVVVIVIVVFIIRAMSTPNSGNYYNQNRQISKSATSNNDTINQTNQSSREEVKRLNFNEIDWNLVTKQCVSPVSEAKLNVLPNDDGENLLNEGRVFDLSFNHFQYITGGEDLTIENRGDKWDLYNKKKLTN